jgi:hypothetical protein
MSDVFDKARQAKDRAAQVATGLKDGITDRVGDAKDALAAGAADLRDAGLARVREAIEELNATLPAIREAGYELTDVSVSIGIPPTVVAAFHDAATYSEERAQKVLEENADRKLTALLLRSLLQARKLQAGIELGGLKPRAIAVQLGLPPSVSIKFA